MSADCSAVAKRSRNSVSTNEPITTTSTIFTASDDRSTWLSPDMTLSFCATRIRTPASTASKIQSSRCTARPQRAIHLWVVPEDSDHGAEGNRGEAGHDRWEGGIRAAHTGVVPAEEPGPI